MAETLLHLADRQVDHGRGFPNTRAASLLRMEHVGAVQREVRLHEHGERQPAATRNPLAGDWIGRPRRFLDGEQDGLSPLRIVKTCAKLAPEPSLGEFVLLPLCLGIERDPLLWRPIGRENRGKPRCLRLEDVHGGTYRSATTR